MYVKCSTHRQDYSDCRESNHQRKYFVEVNTFFLSISFHHQSSMIPLHLVIVITIDLVDPLPMVFLSCGSGTSSYVLFLCRASISSSIIVIHKATSELFKASWKVDGSPFSVKRQYATLISVT